jgi:hypothetical protein
MITNSFIFIIRLIQEERGTRDCDNFRKGVNPIHVGRDTLLSRIRQLTP